MRNQEGKTESQKKVHRKIFVNDIFFDCTPFFLCHFSSFLPSTPALRRKKIFLLYKIVVVVVVGRGGMEGG